MVDSAQVMTSGGSPGTPREVRSVAERLLAFAKRSAVPVLLIGHVTKDGELAGPRVLEHLVDVVLRFTGEPTSDLRLLSSVKNRFGATFEVGVFEMGEQGLTPTPEPSTALLKERTAAPGSVICPLLAGTRPMLVEVQALTAKASTAYPRRVASGIPLSRLLMIIAVLERHAGMKLDATDVIVTIAGGLTVDEPALDAALGLAIASSSSGRALPAQHAFFGEISLTGQLRSVQRIQERKREAKRCGFTAVTRTENITSVAALHAHAFKP